MPCMGPGGAVKVKKSSRIHKTDTVFLTQRAAYPRVFTVRAVRKTSNVPVGALG